MSKAFATVIGISKPSNEKGNKAPLGNMYRVIVYNPSNWDMKKGVMDENKLKQTIASNKFQFTNIGLEGSKLVGTSGSLTRFNVKDKTGFRPVVILSELVYGDRTVGYRVVDFQGSLRRVRLAEILDYCKKVASQGNGELTPIQNGMYVSDTGEKAAHIRSYPNSPFVQEKLARKTSPHASPAKVDMKENTKATKKLEDIFNPEQIEQLKLGKQKGVDFKVYANPKLPAENMKVLREMLELGLNAKLVADPRFSVRALKYYKADMRYGIDVSLYVHPAYTIGHLAILSEAFVEGLDMSKLAIPTMTITEMREEKIRLAREIYKEEDIEEGIDD